MKKKWYKKDTTENAAGSVVLEIILDFPIPILCQTWDLPAHLFVSRKNIDNYRDKEQI